MKAKVCCFFVSSDDCFAWDYLNIPTKNLKKNWSSKNITDTDLKTVLSYEKVHIIWAADMQKEFLPLIWPQFPCEYLTHRWLVISQTLQTCENMSHHSLMCTLEFPLVRVAGALVAGVLWKLSLGYKEGCSETMSAYCYACRPTPPGLISEIKIKKKKIKTVSTYIASCKQNCY